MEGLGAGSEKLENNNENDKYGNDNHYDKNNIHNDNDNGISWIYPVLLFNHDKPF